MAKNRLYEIIKEMSLEEMAEFLCRQTCQVEKPCVHDCKETCPRACEAFEELLNTEWEVI